MFPSKALKEPIRDDSNPQEECLKRPQACVEDVKSWMTFNLLKLNGDKTEFIVFGT